MNHPSSLRRLTRAVFFLLLATLPATSAQPSGPLVFPTVSAYNLDKIHVTLPADFDGDRNLLLISFTSEQAPVLATWNSVAQAIEHTQPRFRVYHLPVSATRNMLYRWWDNASLRANQSDPELWRWTVPLYIDVAAFRSSLAIPDANQAVVLLVDRQGRVLWRATGPASPEQRASLLAAAQK